MKSFSLNNFFRFFNSYIALLIPIVTLSILLSIYFSWTISYEKLFSNIINFDSEFSVHIKPNLINHGSTTIDSQTHLKLKEKLGEFDSSIKNIIPRVNFYGIIKKNNVDSTFKAKGIDINKDREFINSSIKIINGHFLDTKQRDSILISFSLAKKLKLKSGDDVELYTLNRDNFKDKTQEVNKIDVRIDGIFKTGIKTDELIIIPLYLSDKLLKNSDIDEVIVDIYSKQELRKFKKQIRNFLTKLNLRIVEKESFKFKESLLKIFVFVIIISIFIIMFMVNRTIATILDRRQDDIKTLLYNRWSPNAIYNQITIEFTLFFLITTILNFIIVVIFVNFIDLIHLIPALFTNYPISLDFKINIKAISIIVGIISLIVYITAIFSIRGRKIEL